MELGLCQAQRKAQTNFELINLFYDLNEFFSTIKAGNLNPLK